MSMPEHGTPNMNDAINASFGDSVMVQWFGHGSKVHLERQQQ